MQEETLKDKANGYELGASVGTVWGVLLLLLLDAHAGEVGEGVEGVPHAAGSSDGAVR